MDINNVTMTFRGHEHPMSTTLRVAYEVQGQHNHKPYTQVFEGMGGMPIEDQIGILWASFKCANKDYVKEAGITKQDFTEEYLDTCNLKDLMELLEKVVGGIMGEDLTSKKNEKATEPQDVDVNKEEGN